MSNYSPYDPEHELSFTSEHRTFAEKEGYRVASTANGYHHRHAPPATGWREDADLQESLDGVGGRRDSRREEDSQGCEGDSTSAGHAVAI